MADNFNSIYYQGMSPETLASSVLQYVYGEEIPSIPIDPFRLMIKFEIVYQFMKFEHLEGIYLVHCWN